MGTKVQTKLTKKQKLQQAMPAIARGAELSATIKELQAELTEVREQLLALELDYGDYQAPGAELNIKPNNVLNKTRAAQKYGDAVKELVVTPNAVRQHLADNPAAISELYDTGYTLTYRYVGEQ